SASTPARWTGRLSTMDSTARESLPYQRSARQSLDFIHMARTPPKAKSRVARSFPDLESQINAYLVNPKLNQGARNLSVAQECGPRDGRASERVADTRLRLARERDLSHSASRSGSDKFSAVH